MTTVLNQFGRSVGERIRSAFPDLDVVDLAGDDARQGDVLFAIPVRGGTDILRRLGELGVRWVHIGGTGVDSYPLDLLAGQVVTCGRGASAVPIAEYVLAVMLAFEKQLPDVWLKAAPKTWSYAELGTLAGRTLGLVGLGGIGQAIATRAAAFGMRVVAVRRRPEAGSPVPGIEVTDSLDDVLAVSDHLVLAAPATARTRHLIDAAALAKVKSGVHLVNIARGTLVDHDALRIALDDGRVGRASLDVTDPEPLPEGHWLYDHPGVRVTAHISWSAPSALDTLLGHFLENLSRWESGQPLEGIVDLDEGY